MSLPRLNPAQLLLLSYFSIYVIAYSILADISRVNTYSDIINVVTSESNVFFSLRTIVASIIAGLALLRPAILSNPTVAIIVSAATVLSVFSLIIKGNILVPFSIIVYVLSALSLSKLIKLSFSRSGYLLLILAAVYITPAAVALFIGKSHLISNTFYGRQRILLAYFHPKEAAGCLLFLLTCMIGFVKYCPLSLASARSVRLLKRLCVAAIYTSPLLFFLMGSRTTAFISLAVVLALLVSRLSEKTTVFISVSALLLLLPSGFLYLLSDSDLYDSADTILSGRLSMWSRYLDGTLAPGLSYSGLTSALDNSYLNILFDAGIFGLLTYIILLLYNFFLVSLHPRKYTIIPERQVEFALGLYLIGIMAAGFFDTGLTSPTSINFISAWTIYFIASDTDVPYMPI